MSDEEDPPDSSSGGGAEPKLPPLTPDQLALVRMGLPLIELQAADVARRYRSRVEAKELYACGLIGLHEAAAEYRVEQHPSFLYFAQHHVRGRMLNMMRDEVFSLRARVEHAMERAFCRVVGHQLLDVDVWRDEDAELVEGARKGCAEAMAATFVAALTEAKSATPEEALMELEEKAALVAALTAAVAALEPAERRVIELFYGEGMTLGEVAKALGIHKNTAQKRHRLALVKLHAAVVKRPP